MNKLRAFKIITLLSIPVMLTASFVILYINPGLSKTVPDYKYLFIWIALVSVIGGYLNMVYFSMIEKIGDKQKIDKLLSRRGKYYLKKDPSAFFNEEQLNEYFKWQKRFVIFLVSSVLLLLILLSGKLPQ
ncbi:MAG: hypothetical protein JXK07_04420 [Spirochaetes bacterium]|nr:hypothetical protein [Spirochaetota bacterium]MBN2772062.1 hypothetical protein [Spirochaetota bacterium]